MAAEKAPNTRLFDVTVMVSDVKDFYDLCYMVETSEKIEASENIKHVRERLRELLELIRQMTISHLKQKIKEICITLRMDDALIHIAPTLQEILTLGRRMGLRIESQDPFTLSMLGAQLFLVLNTKKSKIVEKLAALLSSRSHYLTEKNFEEIAIALAEFDKYDISTALISQAVRVKMGELSQAMSQAIQEFELPHIASAFRGFKELMECNEKIKNLLFSSEEIEDLRAIFTRHFEVKGTSSPFIITAIHYLDKVKPLYSAHSHFCSYFLDNNFCLESKADYINTHFIKSSVVNEVYEAIAKVASGYIEMNAILREMILQLRVEMSSVRPRKGIAERINQLEEYEWRLPQYHQQATRFNLPLDSLISDWKKTAALISTKNPEDTRLGELNKQIDKLTRCSILLKQQTSSLNYYQKIANYCLRISARLKPAADKKWLYARFLSKSDNSTLFQALLNFFHDVLRTKDHADVHAIYIKIEELFIMHNIKVERLETKKSKETHPDNELLLDIYQDYKKEVDNEIMKAVMSSPTYT